MCRGHRKSDTPIRPSETEVRIFRTRVVEMQHYRDRWIGIERERERRTGNSKELVPCYANGNGEEGRAERKRSLTTRNVNEEIRKIREDLRDAYSCPFVKV